MPIEAAIEAAIRPTQSATILSALDAAIESAAGQAVASTKCAAKQTAVEMPLSSAIIPTISPAVLESDWCTYPPAGSETYFKTIASAEQSSVMST